MLFRSHNSDNEVVDKLLNSIRKSDRVSIYNLKVRGFIRDFVVLHQSPAPEFQTINPLLQESSQQKDFCRNIIVPFLPKDLYGITGLGGSAQNVKVGLKVEISILISHLMSLISQIKSRNLESSSENRLMHGTRPQNCN